MASQSRAYYRLQELYRRIRWRMRALERLARMEHLDRHTLRLHVEMLQPRLMMSVTPTGAQTLADTQTTIHDQHPAIAVNASGASVIVWGTGDSGGGVWGQRFDASGSPVGSEFQVNQANAGGAPLPSVAINALGGFVVTWNSGGADVYARLYDSSGNPVTSDTLVTTQRVGSAASHVAMAANGSFLVQFEGKTTADDDGIDAQPFSAQGVASGAQMLINAPESGAQTQGTVSVDPGGDYTFAWTDKNGGQSIDGAYLPAGAASATPFVVAPVTGGVYPDNASVAYIGNGQSVITWEATAGGGSHVVDYRRYTGSTANDASAVQVAAPNAGSSQYDPAVAGRIDGSFLVGWTGQDANGNGVFAQAFASGGAVDGSLFAVNTTTQQNQQDAAVAWQNNSAVIAWDGGGPTDSAGTYFQRYVTSGASNVAPTISAPGAQSTNENTPLTFSSGHSPSNAITVADSDADGGVEQLTLSVTSGSLSFTPSGSIIAAATSGTTLTLSGTINDLNASINGLVFTPAANTQGSATLSVSLNDLGHSGGGGAKTASTALQISVNAPPTSDTAPGPQRVAANSTLVFSPANANALYVGGSETAVQLSVTSGTLTIANTSGITFGNGTSNGSATLAFSGTVSGMNAALDGLVYTPSAGPGSSDTLTFVTSNGGLLGLGLLSSTTTLTTPLSIVTPANQPPAITLPTAQSCAGNSALTFSSAGGNAIVVADADAQGGTERITLTATGGALTLPSPGAVTLVSGTGSNDASVTFDATIAVINSELNGLTFTPPIGTFGSGAIVVSVNDQGHTGAGGAQSATATLSFPITDTNQAPVLNLPAQQTTARGAPVLFAAAIGNAITLTDADAGSNLQQLSLTVTNGQISLGGANGLTITTGAVSGSSSIVLTGTLADLSAALGSVTFTPASLFTGTGSLSVTFNDLTTGLSATRSCTISVLPAIVVTTTSDVADGNVSSVAALLSEPGTDNAISLREAIDAVNNTAGFYNIEFNIPGTGIEVISPATPLPAVAVPVSIDATTQAGFTTTPMVQLDGSSAGAMADGMALDGGGSALRGLSITGFSRNGLVLQGVGGDTVQSSFIGLTPGGAAAGNGADGILITSGSNTIGGMLAGQGNVVSGNVQDGVVLDGPGAAGNTLEGNYLGVNAAGSSALGNGGNGLTIQNGASSNSIGGNVVPIGLSAFFNRVGISTDGTIVSGGLDGGGNTLPQSQVGASAVWQSAAYSFGPANANDVISAAGQVITLPATHDRTIDILATGTTGNVPNASFVVTYTDNSTQTFTQSISDWAHSHNWAGESIVVHAAYRNTNSSGAQAGDYYVYGYSFTTNASKTVRSLTLPGNAKVEVLAIDAMLAPASGGNVISGNANHGVVIAGAASTHNLLVDNYVGLNAAGNASITNGNDGIYLNATASNAIGDANPTSGNVISGNTNSANLSDGIWISGGGGNTIRQNIIGADATGTQPLGNDHAGITITASTQNLIDTNNRIAFNPIGVCLVGAAATGNTIRFNQIFSNTSLGIDLGDDGPTPNSGAYNLGLPNAGMNTPIFAAGYGSSTLSFSGYVGSASNQAAFAFASVDLYASDGSLNGQGQVYLGTVTADASGHFSGSFNTAAVGIGSQLVAEATDPQGNSSEFSPATAVQPLDAAPTASAPATAAVIEDQPYAFAGNVLSVGDADAMGRIEEVTFDVSGGALSLPTVAGLTFISGAQTGSSHLVIDGTLANLNAALNGLVFVPPTHAWGAQTLGISINDRGNSGYGGPLSASTTVTLNIAPVAHTPSVTNAVTPVSLQTLSGLVATPSALDAGLSVWFDVTGISGGTLYLSDGVTPVTSGEFITAAQGQAGLKFTPGAGASAGAFTLQASLSSDASGLGGSAVTAQVEFLGPPTVTLNPAPLSFTEGQAATPLDSGLTLSDAGVATLAGATVTLGGYAAGEDALAFANAGAITGRWDATAGVLTLGGTASVADYQAALRSVTYSNASLDPTTGPRTIAITIDDGTIRSAVATRTLAVIAVNTPPSITGPAVQSMAEGQSIGLPISVADVDADGAIEQVTLSASVGGLTLQNTSGLTLQAGTGANDATITVSGTLAQLNAALSSVTFAPPPLFSGQTTVSAIINDLGNSGSGGPLNASTTITINVAHVNHAPLLDPLASPVLPSLVSGVRNPAGVTLSDALSSRGGGLIISDVDAGSLGGVAIIGATGREGGSWQYNLGRRWINFGALSDSSATLLPLDAQIRFVPGAAWAGTATLAFRAWDQTSGTVGASGVDASINGGSSAFSLTADVATVTVTAPLPPPPRLVNDTGLVATAASVSTIEPSQLKASSAQQTPADVTYVLVAPPTVGALLVSGAAASAGTRFTQQDIDAGRVAYAAPADAIADDAFAFTITDSAGQSLPTAVFQVHLAAPNPQTNPPPATPPPPTNPPPPAGKGSLPQVPAIASGGAGSQATSPAAGFFSAADASALNSGALNSGANAAGGAVGNDAAGALASDSSAASSAATSVAAGQSGHEKQQTSAPTAALAANPVSHAVALPIPAAVSHGGVEPEARAPVQPRVNAIDQILAGEGLTTVHAQLLVLDPSAIVPPANNLNLSVLAQNRGRYTGALAASATFSQNSALWRDLDSMADGAAAGHRARVIAGSASLVSVGVSVIYFLWAVRAGSILSSLISSMPAWRLVDPLPILDQMGEADDPESEDDERDETLQSMVGDKAPV